MSHRPYGRQYRRVVGGFLRYRKGMANAFVEIEMTDSVYSFSGFCAVSESGPLRAVHLSRHQWPGGFFK